MCHNTHDMCNVIFSCVVFPPVADVCCGVAGREPATLPKKVAQAPEKCPFCGLALRDVRACCRCRCAVTCAVLCCHGSCYAVSL